jgi:exosortase
MALPVVSRRAGKRAMRLSDTVMLRPEGADGRAALTRHAFLFAAVLIWFLPPLVAVAHRHWTTQQGGHEPIILITGCWAAWHQARARWSSRRPGSLPWAVGWIALAAIFYVAARMTGATSLELLAAYGGVVAVLYAKLGRVLIRQLAGPLVYLAFIVPPPYSLTIALTDWLKPWIAQTSIDALFTAGLDVASSGNTLFVDGYELLVETACSGLNSLVSLTAIGLFFIYWRDRGDRRETIVLALLVPVVAIVANLARVMLLLWLVHERGMLVLRTAFHPGAGIAMFVVALALLALADAILRAGRGRGAS